MNRFTLSDSVLIGLDDLDDDPHLLFLGTSGDGVTGMDPAAKYKAMSLSTYSYE